MHEDFQAETNLLTSKTEASAGWCDWGILGQGDQGNRMPWARALLFWSIFYGWLVGVEFNAPPPHPFNGPFSGTTQVSRYQKGKNQSGFYWSKRQWVAVASAGPYASLHLAPDRQPHQHPTTLFFTGRMPFLPPNQQPQSTEGIYKSHEIISI